MTSRIAAVSSAENAAAVERSFVAMELPKFPLDSDFQVKVKQVA